MAMYYGFMPVYTAYLMIFGYKGKKAITAIVEETLPHDRPGDFNQALMLRERIHLQRETQEGFRIHQTSPVI